MSTGTPNDTVMPTSVRAFRYTGFHGLSSLNKITVWMTKGEVGLFSSILVQNRESPYLEFGAGGSTLLAAAIVPQVISVENDLAFINQIIRKLKTRPKRSDPLFFHIDQNPIGEWGFPETIDPAILRKYAETVWLESAVPATVKTVLVDGRFRRACLLHAIRHLDTSVDFLVHDSDRYMDLVNDFFVEVKRVDTLRHLRKMPGVTEDRIASRLAEVQDDKN
jgi:hypothetical protein